MITKGLSGKIVRFFSGRFSAIREKSSLDGGIRPSCLVKYSPDKNATHPNRPLVIFYSGDGGWANLTSFVSEQLQKSGFPVVGIDCMQYFWNEKNPDVAANELTHLISENLTSLKIDSVILLGYSMGADVLPLITRHLPDELKSRIDQMILLSPSPRVELKFRFIGWLGFVTSRDSGFPLLPDLEALSSTVPITCFAGEKESDSIAPDLSSDVATVKILPGGHHYGSDYEKLAHEILTAVQAVSSQE